MPHPTSPSPVQALLALSAIGGAGVENSIVFAQLPASAQVAIRAVSDEEQKRILAMAAGDGLQVIRDMHEHYVAAPARRTDRGLAFPALASLDDFPLPGIVREEDRSWLRPGRSIASISVVPQDFGFAVCLTYADGEIRQAAHEGHTTHRREVAMDLQRHVHQAAFILGIHERQQ